jgi:squalene cyclase
VIPTALAAAPSPEDRAILYLAEEVRQWPIDNHCFSCHNNGDGARALLIAVKLGKQVPSEALQQTTEWLARPAGWQRAADNPGVSDKVLATIQFAAALSEMPEGVALIKAAALLLPYQKPDGSWPSDQGSIGSPATYGTSLATYLAGRTLELADKVRFAEPIARSRSWLATRKPGSVPDIAASMLAGAADHTSLLLVAQNGDGGWGPWAQSPSEAFDTSLALLAMKKDSKTASAIARGRAYLIKSQQASGGWPETTRPPGGQSYAQHISTTAWATIALLRTNPERN